MRSLSSLFLSLLIVTAAMAAPTVYPTGVTIHDPSQVWPGNNLFIDMNAGLIQLIDMEGDLVKEWGAVNGDVPHELAEMLPNGNVLAMYRAPAGNKLIERDWNGDVVWELQMPPAVTIHHDFERLPNGNTLVLVRRVRTVPQVGPNPIWDDWLHELTPQGQPVWHWSTAAHYSQLPLSAEARNLIWSENANGKQDVFHTNSIFTLPPNPHFATGDILVSQRETDLVFVIERATGNIVWSTQSTIAQHHPTMVGSNILLLDNGGDSGYPLVSRAWSRVIEIDPATKAEVWAWDAQIGGLAPAVTFFGEFLGSAQRLPNGNTLVTEGPWGRAFELTPAGQIVWEYILPSRSPIYRMSRVP